MRLLFILAFIYLLEAQTYDLPNNDADCPANCRQIPWLAGSDQWNGGSLPTYTAVPCVSGLTQGDGTTNNSMAIQACLNNLGSNQAAVLPAGIYYVNGTITIASNKALRGAKILTTRLPNTDATLTTLKFGASGLIQFGQSGVGGYSGGGTERVISSGYTKGSQSLTMASGHGFTANTWISVYENGDSSIPTTSTGDDGACTWCGQNNGSDLIQQFVQVLTVNSNTITISRPLYYTYASGNSPAAKTWPFAVSNAGIEDLRLNGSYADHDVFIGMSGVLFCWVRDVETYDSGTSSKNNHVNISWSHGVEVRDSYFHDGRDSSSDRNYGIAMFFWNSDHKIENNILRHNRHSFAMEGGGMGSAFLYNYVDDNYTDDTSYLGSARFNHGAHPMFNLFEGNIMSHITADSYWGSSSHFVLFRNWLWGDETGTGVPAKPTWGYYPLDVWYNQNYYSVVGNVLGVVGKWGNPTWSGYTLRNSNCSQDAIYNYGCDSSGNYSSKASTSSINHGNYDYKTVGVAYWEGGANHALNTSMYYASKPSFFGTCAWPGIGPDITPVASANPAMRAFAGTPCSTSPPGGSSFGGILSIGGKVVVH